MGEKIAIPSGSYPVRYTAGETKMTKTKIRKLITTIKGWGLDLYEKRENYLRFKRDNTIGLVITMFDNEWSYYLINEISLDDEKWQALVDDLNKLDKMINDLTLTKNWVKDIKKKMKDIETIYDLKELK